MTGKNAKLTVRERLEKGFGAEELGPVATREGLDAEVLADLVHSGQVALFGNNRRRESPLVAVGYGQLTKSALTLAPTAGEPPANGEFLLRGLLKQARSHEIDLLLDRGFLQAGDLNFKRLMRAWNGPVLVQPFGEGQALEGMGFGKTELFERVAWCLEQGAAGVSLPVGLHTDFLARYGGPQTRMPYSPGARALVRWMLATGKENPFNEFFDELLEPFREVDAVLILENALSAINLQESALDTAHYHHLITLSDMALHALERGVMVVIQVNGFFPLHDLKTYLNFIRTVTQGMPVMLDGPTPTHLAGRHQWSASLFGSLMALQEGGDMVLSPPVSRWGGGNVADILAMTRQVAHLADVTRGNPKALEREYGAIDAAEKGKSGEEFLLGPGLPDEPGPEPTVSG